MAIPRHSKYNYKKLLSEKQFLRVKERANRLNGVHLADIQFNKDTLVFKCVSGTDHKTVWTQTVIIDDLVALHKAMFDRKGRKVAQKNPLPRRISENASKRNVDKLIKNSGLHLACDCPAWLFWGFKFISYHRGYGIEPEHRVPRIRNPHQQGFVCHPEGEKMLTDRGVLNVEDIKPGMYLFDKDGYRTKVVSVVEFDSKELIEVRVGIKKSFRLTPDHKVFAFKGNYGKPSSYSDVYPLSNCSEPSRFAVIKPDWVEVSKLEDGDFLFRGKLKLSEFINVDLGYAFLAGLYAADGNLMYKYRKGICSKLLLKDSWYVDALAINCSWSNKDGYQELFDSYGIKIDKWYKHSVRKEDAAIFIRDKDLISFCIKNVNYHSNRFGEEKGLNLDILNWNIEAKKAFLEGYFLGDGTMSKLKGRLMLISWMSTNKQMIDIVYTLLCSFGYPDIYKKNRSKENEKYKDCYVVNFTGSDCEDLMQVLNLPLKAKGLKEDFRFSDRKKKNWNDYRIEVVKEVNSIKYSGKVYSFETDSGNYLNFQQIVTLNCKHCYQVLQVLPFLAREIGNKFYKAGLLSDDDMKDKNLQRQVDRTPDKKKDSLVATSGSLKGISTTPSSTIGQRVLSKEDAPVVVDETKGSGKGKDVVPAGGKSLIKGGRSLTDL